MARTDRRHLTRVLLSLWLCVSALAGASAARGEASGQRVARWGIFEVSLAGPSSGNPFVGVRLSARFEEDGAVFTPEGIRILKVGRVAQVLSERGRRTAPGAVLVLPRTGVLMRRVYGKSQ